MPKEPQVEREGALEEEEMVLILEGIARYGAETARISAIKALLALRRDSKEPGSPAGFEALDELAPRRRAEHR